MYYADATPTIEDRHSSDYLLYEDFESNPFLEEKPVYVPI